MWPVAAGTLAPYWENGKIVEQAQNRRTFAGRLIVLLTPLQALLLCTQKEKKKKSMHINEEGTKRH